MRSINSNIFAVPEILRRDVECFRTTQYNGKQGLAIKVALNGLPGIVLQHRDGLSPVKSIITPSRTNFSVPALYIYGQTTEPGVLTHSQGPYTLTQVILKPHALNTLFGLNASALTNELLELREFPDTWLHEQLLEANGEQDRIALLTSFLIARLKQARTRDLLVEESLRLVHKNIAFVTVRALLDQLHISERQFERRFNQAVGVSPKFYIRVRRFKEAIKLMKTRQVRKLTEIAHILNFHDQSHFIRDMRAFSGTTPKKLTHLHDDFDPVQAVYSYVAT